MIHDKSYSEQSFEKKNINLILDYDETSPQAKNLGFGSDVNCLLIRTFCYLDVLGTEGH